MNNRRYATACFVLIITFSSAATSFAQERRSPEKFVAEWAKAVAVNKADAVLKFYEQSDELDVRISSGKRIVGIREVKKIYESDFEQVAFSKSTAAKLQVRLVESLAIVSFEHQLQFKMKTDSSEFEGRVQTVMVLQQTKNDWAIINEHSSPIHGVPRLKPVDE